MDKYRLNMIGKLLNIKTGLLMALVCTPLLAFAVSQKEMEQARTIAAKAYIRYANDGSGYLDDINPTTMEELEAALKTKEKENIKAFKAIPVPTDYKDWNKDKLMEYWAVTAFQDKGLLEKGRGGRIRARSQINKMTIAPPQAEATPVASVVTTDSSTPKISPSDSANNQGSNLKELQAEEQAALSSEEDFDDEDLNVDKAYNYTWVYIMILAILVAIVVALVVYAANVLKKNGNKEVEESHRRQEDSEALEHYESVVADKDVEIAMLKKKLESANRQNSELKSKLDALTAEIASLRTRVNTVSEPQKREISPEPEIQKTVVRTIYLGRANIRGVFVRADRNLNIGNSIFVLDTSDGFSGSFRVADSPAAWSLALSNPREYLETACTGRDLDNTNDVSKIVTESAGTAVFEGGCWRVIRKARIRYE